MNLAADTLDGIACGRFRVLPHRRELLADEVPIKLGVRAFDLLMVLIATPRAVITKDDLLARVWPDRVVAEANLKSQILALRHAFGAERDLIRTVAGRGYQFIGDVQVMLPDMAARGAAWSLAPAGDAAAIPTNLPPPVSELIGRDDGGEGVVSCARAARLVQLTGAGGIGKTRIPLAPPRRLLPQFPDGV